MSEQAEHRSGWPGRHGSDDADEELRVEITDDDVRAARRLWLAALADEDAPARAERLHEDLRRLIHAQAQQIADDFRAARRAAQRAAADELRAARLRHRAG